MQEISINTYQENWCTILWSCPNSLFQPSDDPDWLIDHGYDMMLHQKELQELFPHLICNEDDFGPFDIDKVLVNAKNQKTNAVMNTFSTKAKCCQCLTLQLTVAHHKGLIMPPDLLQRKQEEGIQGNRSIKGCK